MRKSGLEIRFRDFELSLTNVGPSCGNKHRHGPEDTKQGIGLLCFSG